MTIENRDGGGDIGALAVAGSTIAVIGIDIFSVTKWNLGVGNGRANLDNYVLNTRFKLPPFSQQLFRPSLWISPDLSCVVTLAPHETYHPELHLDIYDVSTGGLLASAKTEGRREHQLLVSPDGCEIWIGGPCWDRPAERWGIVENGESGVTGLRPLGMAQYPPEALPWRSSRGYEVTGDGWILNPTRKRLLWLPHRWRSGKESRKWSGQFLGLGHRELPKAVLLGFLE